MVTLAASFDADVSDVLESGWESMRGLLIDGVPGSAGDAVLKVC
jgi:hypothetical protein